MEFFDSSFYWKLGYNPSFEPFNGFLAFLVQNSVPQTLDQCFSNFFVPCPFFTLDTSLLPPKPNEELYLKKSMQTVVLS